MMISASTWWPQTQHNDLSHNMMISASTWWSQLQYDDDLKLNIMTSISTWWSHSQLDDLSLNIMTSVSTWCSQPQQCQLHVFMKVYFFYRDCIQRSPKNKNQLLLTRNTIFKIIICFLKWLKGWMILSANPKHLNVFFCSWCGMFLNYCSHSSVSLCHAWLASTDHDVIIVHCGFFLSEIWLSKYDLFKVW